MGGPVAPAATRVGHGQPAGLKTFIPNSAPPTYRTVLYCALPQGAISRHQQDQEQYANKDIKRLSPN
jgi:hypothetical protein